MLDNTHYNITLLITFVEILVIFLFVEIQSTPHNSNLQGKKKKVRVRNENCFELAGGSSFRGFEIPGVDCTCHFTAFLMLILALTICK